MRANGLRPYPAYRNSGPDWLGKVPAHWEVRRMATVADLRVSNVDKHIREGESPVRLCNYVDVYHNDRIGARVPFMAGTAKEREIRKFRLAVGDVLITKDSEDWSDIGVPALVEYASHDLLCGYHLAMLRPNGASLDGGYLFQALKESRVAWQCQVAAAGVTRFGLSQNAIRSMRVPLPPLPEQRAIARFLDATDRRIRRYIRAKERLIELLEERKRALIHEAVTGRIDVRTGQPYPAYKDSGVEWLGKVPEHWEVRRARYVFREIDHRSRAGSEQHLSMSQRLGLVPSHLVENRTLVSKSHAGGKLCDIDDLVLNRLKAHLGVFALARHQGIVSPDYTVLRLKRAGAMEFFERVLRSSGCRTELRIRAKGIVEGFWRLYTDDFNEIKIPVPPVEEQVTIAAWLRSTGDRVNRLAASASRLIGLLREYRTRLIADVVTGKLDVREAAARITGTDPRAGDRDQADAIPTESNLHSATHDVMKEVSA